MFGRLHVKHMYVKSEPCFDAYLHSQANKIYLLLPVLLVLFISPQLCAQAEVDRYGVFEITLTATGNYPNPYQQGWLLAAFISPSNDTMRIPGFWDGGAIWKVRISPNQEGNWYYFTSSDNPGLTQSGTFKCVHSNCSGGIKPMDGYHFKYENGTPFWWFGETCWAAFKTNPAENLTEETFKEYIDVRSAQGFNYIHCFALMGPNDGGDPFLGPIGEEVNPMFWQKVDQRIAYMNHKNIAVGFLLAWKEGQWSQFKDQTSRKRYCRYVAARYSAYNVVWIISGEYDEEPYLDPNSIQEWSELAMEIKKNDPHHRMITIHGTGSVSEFANLGWMSFGDYMQIYDHLHNKILAARLYDKPVINAEYAYFLRDKDGDGVVDKPNSATLEEFRNASWDIVMAGGYFVTGFGTTYAGGEKDPGPFNVHDPKNDPAEEDLQHIRTFFTTIENWWQLEPADASITGNGIHYCLREIGKHYIVYVRNATDPFMLDLGTASFDNYIIKTFNPRTGEWKDTLTMDISGSVSLRPPDGNDWLFELKYNYTIPVELSSFEVYQEAGHIILTWITETEANNFGFEIQRKSNQEEFKTIAFIKGHGTSTSPHQYYYHDANLPAGCYSYRLKQINNDGSFQYSEIRTTILTRQFSFKLHQRYPNPFNIETNLAFELPGDGNLQLCIYNLRGQLIRELINGYISMGCYNFSWDGRDSQGNLMNDGVYFAAIRWNDHQQVIKMILLK